MVCDRNVPEADDILTGHSEPTGYSYQTRYALVGYAVYDLPVTVEQIFDSAPYIEPVAEAPGGAKVERCCRAE